MTDRELLSLAREAMKNSHSPYSRFAVGAALECSDGEVYTGCNVENASFGATICAETVAIVTAVARGKREFRRVAIVSDGSDYTLPCGTCRQMLQEFAPEIEILGARADGRYVSYRLRELMPFPFTLK